MTGISEGGRDLDFDQVKGRQEVYVEHQPHGHQPPTIHVVSRDLTISIHDSKAHHTRRQPKAQKHAQRNQTAPGPHNLHHPHMSHERRSLRVRSLLFLQPWMSVGVPLAGALSDNEGGTQDPYGRKTCAVLNE